MRLQLSAHGHHTEMVTACCWTPTNELITCSDDQTVCKWSLNGEMQGEVCKVVGHRLQGACRRPFKVSIKQFWG